jgi:large subunit ribosomal protein L21
MYAVINTGGKQYRVAKGDVVRVELLRDDVGAKVSIDAVSLVAADDQVHVGTPVVDGASVEATVVEIGRGQKLLAFKKKRRKGYRRKIGHRQSFTALQIDDIVLPTGGKSAAKKAALKKAAVKEAPAKETAAKAPKKVAAGDDNLKRIEGIGPKIESVLKDAGIATFAALAGSDEAALRDVLEAAGGRLRSHDPTTWPAQAALAAEERWDDLKELQDRLAGGREG